MADTTMPRGLPPSAITHLNRLSADEAVAVKEQLSARGVRLLPYPFASALAIVSDVDASRRERYFGYIGQLVDDLGLDFGDSTWLSWYSASRGTIKRSRQLRIGLGLGLFTPWLTVGRDVDDERFLNTRTFNESLVEFHKGNLDHFHAFFMRGMRVVPLKDFQADDEGRITVTLGPIQNQGPWSCESVFALGVCVVGAPNANLEIRRLLITNTDADSIEYEPTAYASPPGDRQYRLFSIGGRADEDKNAPALDEIGSITLEFASPQHGSSIERVLILSAHTDLIVERLRWLRERYNVEMNLITEHSRFHFSEVKKNDVFDLQLRQHVAVHEGPLEAYHGSLTDENGDYVFSTHSDEPHAFGRMFPELSRDLEFRFVNPAATMSAKAWDPLELVTPSPTRSGGGIYYARRTRPSAVVQADPNRMDPTHTRQDTLAIRVSNVLDGVSENSGLFCPIYTHLGSYDDDTYEDRGIRDVRGIPVPVPYLDADIMYRLQDHIYNITGSVPPHSRVWFSRATAHYDYALILRGIGANLDRTDRNRIEIRSWTDACLGKTLPRSTGQLYGLTFYVDDPARAKVLLDGAAIDHLFRNPPDETGRGSVTIAACDLRYTVFDQLDPTYNLSADGKAAAEPPRRDPIDTEALLTGARWTWRAHKGIDRSFGRLKLLAPAPGQAADRVVGSLRLPMFGWTPTGAQAASLRRRAKGGAKFGVLLETRTGGRFYFGDEPLQAIGGAPVTGSYQLITTEEGEERWRRFTIPFHDLAWAPDARPGGPMPNHSLEWVTLFVIGDPDSAIDFADLVFLRPRTITPTEATEGRHCLGGRVVDFHPGQIVHAIRADDGSGRAFETTADQRGFFCFDRMARGIYDVWTKSGEGKAHDRRGPRVEVNEDNVTLVLVAPDSEI